MNAVSAQALSCRVCDKTTQKYPAHVWKHSNLVVHLLSSYLRAPWPTNSTGEKLSRLWATSYRVAKIFHKDVTKPWASFACLLFVVVGGIRKLFYVIGLEN